MSRRLSWRPSSDHLAAMSEAALLVRAMRPGPPRALIAVHILAFFFAIVGLALFVGPSETGGWTRAIFLGCLFGWVPGLIAVLTLMVYFDERFGPVAYEDELLRRAGWQSFERLTELAREQWTEMPGPGWLLLFCGRALPHGGQHFVRVTLFQSGEQPCPVSYGGLRWASPAAIHLEPRERVYLGTAELLPDERDDLFEIIEAGNEAQKSNSTEPDAGWVGAPSRVIDGYPFDLVALRRGPGDSHEVAGNLADPDGPARARRLAARMLDIAQRAGAPRSTFGTIEEGHLVFTER